jgi:predicted transcriptional regulator
MAIKNVRAENEVLNLNAASLLRNIVMMAVREKSKTCEEISSYSGIDKDKLKPFLDEFVKGGLLKEMNGEYSLKR